MIWYSLYRRSPWHDFVVASLLCFGITFTTSHYTLSNKTICFYSPSHVPMCASHAWLGSTFPLYFVSFGRGSHLPLFCQLFSVIKFIGKLLALWHLLCYWFLWAIVILTYWNYSIAIQFFGIFKTVVVETFHWKPQCHGGIRRKVLWANHWHHHLRTTNVCTKSCTSPKTVFRGSWVFSQGSEKNKPTDGISLALCYVVYCFSFYSEFCMYFTS